MKRCFVATGYVVRDGKTLLLKHRKLGMWLPPGGHIDEGETPDEACLREILEETGLTAEICSSRRGPDPADGRVKYLPLPDHVQLEDIPNHPQHVDFIYFCRAGEGSVTLSEREAGGMRWFSEQELAADPELSEEVRLTGALAIRRVSAKDLAKK
jgi:8-oxo-dGTP pyrophosphatase MutT (NUDIX family)